MPVFFIQKIGKEKIKVSELIDRKIFIFGESLLDKYDYKLPNQDNKTEEQKVRNDIDEYKKKHGTEQYEDEYLEAVFNHIRNKWVMRRAEKILHKDMMLLMDFIENADPQDADELSNLFAASESVLSSLTDKYLNTPLMKFADEVSGITFVQTYERQFEKFNPNMENEA